jgi:hypothetical protein
VDICVIGLEVRPYGEYNLAPKISFVLFLALSPFLSLSEINCRVASDIRRSNCLKMLPFKPIPKERQNYFSAIDTCTTCGRKRTGPRSVYPLACMW